MVLQNGFLYCASKVVILLQEKKHFPKPKLSLCLFVIQDGRADVVANDAGDRVTSAVVAYRDDEQVQHIFPFIS